MKHQLKVLKDYKDELIGGEEALSEISNAYIMDLGHTTLDLQRKSRVGCEEVIYGERKTSEQISDICLAQINSGQNVLVTRVSKKKAKAIRETIPEMTYDPTARCLLLQVAPPKSADKPIAVINAGTSDLAISEEAAICAEFYGNKVLRVNDVGVAGIHRLFARLEDIRQAAVVIAVAGMEGALPSVIAGLVDVPVIAVPTDVGYGTNLNGITTLLSMLNSCSSGVSVVNVNNGFGAAYQASLINRGRE